MRLRTVSVTFLLLLLSTLVGCKSLLVYEARLEEVGEDEEEVEDVNHGPRSAFDKGTPRSPNKYRYDDPLLVSDDMETDMCTACESVPLLDAQSIYRMLKAKKYTDLDNSLGTSSKYTLPKKLAEQCNGPLLVFDGTVPYPELVKRKMKLEFREPNLEFGKAIMDRKLERQCVPKSPLVVMGTRVSTSRKKGHAAQFVCKTSMEPDVRKSRYKRNQRTHECVADPIMVISEGHAHPEVGAVKKRNGEEYDLASVPWQALWLLESPEGDCGVKVQEAVLRLQAAQNVLNRPQQPLGRCPVRFRPYADPNRWLPRNLVIAECVCENSPCGRLGTHVCITVYAVRTVFNLQTRSRRILLAVGCLCALQKARLAKLNVPQVVV